MTVAELIQELQKLPPDLQVIIQKDAEGNGYSPLNTVDPDCIYVERSTWSGEVHSIEWSWEDACFDSLEGWEQFKASRPRCCVLVPVN